jgi:hypothetical protein
MQFTFQINIVGTLQAESVEEARELIKKQIQKLKPEDYYQATDFYHMDESGYQRNWVSKKNG